MTLRLTCHSPGVRHGGGHAARRAVGSTRSFALVGEDARLTAPTTGALCMLARKWPYLPAVHTRRTRRRLLWRGIEGKASHGSLLSAVAVSPPVGALRWDV